MKRLLLALFCCSFVHYLNAQSNKPIFIVEGQRMNSNILSFLPAEKIQSIVVLKGEQAKAKYKLTDAEEGVIEIKLKNKILFLSYAQLLDSFAIPDADKNLPVFIDKYFLRDKEHFYALKNQIKDISIDTVDNRKIIRIYTVKKYNPYSTVNGNYMINGQTASGSSIDFINLDAVRSIARLNYDEASEIYGYNISNIVTIYLNEKDSVKPLAYFYNKFHISAEAQDWPIFFANTDKEIVATNFVAMPSAVKNILVNEKEMRVEIEAAPTPQGEKTLAEKIKESANSRGLRQVIMICAISRKMLLHAYVKK